MGFLRFFLAAAVLLGHAPPGVLAAPLWGPLAVETFFLISGFYMQFIIGSYAAGGGLWQQRFYASRLLRLFPLYLLVLALSAAFMICCGDTARMMEILHSGRWDSIFIYFFSNLFILGQDALRFTVFDPADGAFHFAAVATDARIHGAGYPLLGQAWSLALELMFYGLAPFVLLRSTKTVAWVAGLSLAVKIIVLKSGLKWENADWVWGFFPAELSVFLAGALACRYMRARKAALPQGWQTLPYLVMAGAYLLYGFHYRELPGGKAAKYYVFLIATGALLPWLFSLSKDSRFDRWLGECSYPIYLMHFLIIGVLSRLGVATDYVGIATLALCVALGLAFVRWVETPMDRYRHRRFKEAAA